MERKFARSRRPNKGRKGRRGCPAKTVKTQPGTQSLAPALAQPGDSQRAQADEHIASTFETSDDLVLLYEQRKKLGMNPVWCVDHGHGFPPTIKIQTAVIGRGSSTILLLLTRQPTMLIAAEFDEERVGYDLQPKELTARVGVAKTMNL
ncbi:hypothetical protein EDD36DRAFT_469939 [Exophiala viscosa]|uniref:Uncharacterized protein n=1 Tax=Exophiala viscosa TaxID=2486360 RepID=A0AAN6DJJ3_9EURO|nr:hypothetical protein EDD36DRAFT_469939 [Exophiala viscosa]